MTEENIIAKTPLDNGKIPFNEYFNSIWDEIYENTDYTKGYVDVLSQEVLIPKHRGFFATYKNNTYFAHVKYNSKEKIYFLTVDKIINAVIQKVENHQYIYNDRTKNPPYANIVITLKLPNGEMSEEVILDEKAKSNFNDFNIAVNKSNNNILMQLTGVSFTTFKEYINSFSERKIYRFINQGRVNYKNLTGRLYENAYTQDGAIIPSNSEGFVPIEKIGISLDKTRLSINPSLYLGEFNALEEVFKLLTQMEQVYKGRIEPYLCLGAAILCMYIDEIWDNCIGFPVVYLHGNTKQGKSLLQGIISNIYGFTNKQIAMGNSTDNAIAMKCHRINATPVCINDYDFFQSQGTKFENNVVQFYELGFKEKLYDGTRFNLMPISSTAIYSSNYMPCDKPKIFNRLLPLYFPDNGIDTTKITNEFVNDIKRSRILVEIQKFNRDSVIKFIQDVEKYILGFEIFPGKDRESNNVAIAYAGLLLLEQISSFKLKNQEALLKEYCQWYQDLIEKTVTPVDSFLNALPALYVNGRIKNLTDFKIENENNRIIFTFDTQCCIKEYNTYCADPNGQGMALINNRTFAYDLKASKYFKARNTVYFKNKGSTSATILDITDSINGKSFFNLVTGQYPYK